MIARTHRANLERPAGLTRRFRAYALRLIQFAKTKPLGGIGLLIAVAVTIMALFAPLLAPWEPDLSHLGHRLEAPSATFWLGTNSISQDVLSRLIYGARISLFVGLSTAIIGGVLGLLVGVITAYFGGYLDMAVQRVVDTLMGFPPLLLALLLVALMGRSLASVIIALVLINLPRVARTVRSTALSVAASEYVEAIRAIGGSHTRIVLRHIMPNCMVPVIILGSANVGWAIVIEATLSFFGLGVPPNIPTWGGMLSQGSEHIFTGRWWLVVFPGLALAIVVFGINVFGDALRDVLDPRLRA